jgi:hypothetical protein
MVMQQALVDLEQIRALHIRVDPLRTPAAVRERVEELPRGPFRGYRRLREWRFELPGRTLEFVGTQMLSGSFADERAPDGAELVGRALALAAGWELPAGSRTRRSRLGGARSGRVQRVVVGDDALQRQSQGAGRVGCAHVLAAN